MCAGTGSIDDIDSVEFYGRVISGFAVALGFLDGKVFLGISEINMQQLL